MGTMDDEDNVEDTGEPSSGPPRLFPQEGAVDAERDVAAEIRDVIAALPDGDVIDLPHLCEELRAGKGYVAEGVVKAAVEAMVRSGAVAVVRGEPIRYEKRLPITVELEARFGRVSRHIRREIERCASLVDAAKKKFKEAEATAAAKIASLTQTLRDMDEAADEGSYLLVVERAYKLHDATTRQTGVYDYDTHEFITWDDLRDLPEGSQPALPGLDATDPHTGAPPATTAKVPARRGRKPKPSAPAAQEPTPGDTKTSAPQGDSDAADSTAADEPVADADDAPPETKPATRMASNRPLPPQQEPASEPPRAEPGVDAEQRAADEATAEKAAEAAAVKPVMRGPLKVSVLKAVAAEMVEKGGPCLWAGADGVMLPAFAEAVAGKVGFANPADKAFTTLLQAAVTSQVKNTILSETRDENGVTLHYGVAPAASDATADGDDARAEGDASRWRGVHVASGAAPPA